MQVKLTDHETRSCPTVPKALPDQQTRFRSSPPAVCQTRAGWGQPAGCPLPHGCSVLPLGSFLNTWERQVTGPGSLHPADSRPLTPAAARAVSISAYPGGRPRQRPLGPGSGAFLRGPWGPGHWVLHLLRPGASGEARADPRRGGA